MSSPFVILNHARFRQYVTHAELEELHCGMRWAEGPVWFADTQTLLFSDIPANRLMRWSEGQPASILRENSGKSNGLTRDRQGRLLVCESGNRRVTRVELDGTTTVIADGFRGMRFNSPNDIVVKSDGSIWFTDPDYGLMSDYTGSRGQSEIGSCNVYRVDSDGSIDVVIESLQKPNGLAFSPDEKTLYVADSGATHIPEGNHAVYAYEIVGNRPTDGHKLATIERGVPDGLRIDIDGNLWVCTVHAGISVFAPDGEEIGRIDIPGSTANLAFSGPHLNRLLITAGTRLYGLYTGTRGISPV